jgi:hypothetical protein
MSQTNEATLNNDKQALSIFLEIATTANLAREIAMEGRDGLNAETASHVVRRLVEQMGYLADQGTAIYSNGKPQAIGGAEAWMMY